MTKQKSQIYIMLAVILFGSLYVYIQYLFLPQWNVIKEKSAHLSAIQGQLTKLEDSSKILSDLQQQQKDLMVQVSELANKVPKKLDKPDIMLTVSSMAKSNGLSPKSLSYDPLKEEDGIYSMGLNFSCTGPEENVYNLVEDFLKGNKYIFALDSISISPAEGGVSASMRLVTYGYK